MTARETVDAVSAELGRKAKLQLAEAITRTVYWNGLPAAMETITRCFSALMIAETKLHCNDAKAAMARVVTDLQLIQQGPAVEAFSKHTAVPFPLGHRCPTCTPKDSPPGPA